MKRYYYSDTGPRPARPVWRNRQITFTSSELASCAEKTINDNIIVVGIAVFEPENLGGNELIDWWIYAMLDDGTEAQIYHNRVDFPVYATVFKYENIPDGRRVVGLRVKACSNISDTNASIRVTIAYVSIAS